MATDTPSIDEQAIAWTIRARDMDFHDWDALTLWLEADPAHAEAFQRMTLLDDMLPAMVQPSPVVEDWQDVPASPVRRWSFARVSAVAAALIAAVMLSFMMLRPDHYSVETGAGEQHSIALADGSKIELNGDTKITLSRDDPRSAVLDRGEALFVVVHNDQHPFTVTVGDAVVQDAGTVFNIIRAGDMTEVGVSEGLVIYNPDKQRVALEPGDALRANDGSAGIEKFAVATSAVGSWQRRQLSYNGATLDRVAADISRSLGEKVTISPSLNAARFTGTLNLKKDSGSFFKDAAPVLGVRAERKSNGWILLGANEAGG